MELCQLQTLHHPSALFKNQNLAKQTLLDPDAVILEGFDGVLGVLTGFELFARPQHLEALKPPRPETLDTGA